MGPDDSLKVLRPPIDRTMPDGTEATSFFANVSTGIFRVVARGKVGSPLVLRVTYFAGYVGP